MTDYPINYEARDDKENHVSGLAEDHKWEDLIKYLKDSDYRINYTRRPLKNDPPPSLMTPLHHAANGNAPKEIFNSILELGASRCLKTAEGETAYDIGKRKGLSEDILDLIKIPKHVKQNMKIITDMENAMHSLLKGNVGILACLNDNKQPLPQLSFLFENPEMDYFFFYVPGMHGGVTVTLQEDGNMIVAWYSNIVSGSAESYLVAKDGAITKQQVYSDAYLNECKD